MIRAFATPGRWHARTVLRRRGEGIILSSVVAAKAGTHNHRLSCYRKPFATVPKSAAAAYGSLLSQRRQESEFAVQPAREDVDRSAVGIVGGIGDELIVGGQRQLLVERVCVIGFEDSLAPVVELAVSDQNAEPAGGDEIAMVSRQRVDGAADPDHVVGPAPFGALERKAKRERGIDIGERHDLGLAVVPAPPPEQYNFVAQGLFEVDDVAVFDAAPAGLRDIEIKGRIVQRLAVASGKGAVEPRDGSQF